MQNRIQNQISPTCKISHFRFNMDVKKLNYIYKYIYIYIYIYKETKGFTSYYRTWYYRKKNTEQDEVCLGFIRDKCDLCKQLQKFISKEIINTQK
jgi:hypothetical protein